MQQYNQFYRDFGIYRVNSMGGQRRINKMLDFVMPRGSVYHYLPEDNVNKGIPSDHIVVRNSERLVMVDHVTELSQNANNGRPRSSAVQGSKLIRDYHRRHRKLKMVRNLEINVKDERTLLVVNYALLDDLYRYTQSVYSNHYKALNVEVTFWESIKWYIQKTNRHHFIKLDLPIPLPTLANMRYVEENIPKQNINDFNDVNSLIMLSLWRWLGKKEKGPIAQLKRESLNQINLIVQHENHWCLINLGLLQSWKDGVEGDRDIRPDALQKRFLRLMMKLVEASSPSTQPTEQVDDVEEKEESIEEVKDDLKNTEEDNQQLEKEVTLINEREIKQQVDEDQNDIFTDTDDDKLKEGVMKEADALAEDGLISAAEYRRFEAMSERYKSLPNPRTGEGKLTEVSKITPDELKIEAPNQLPDSVGVVDKSMLKTTLQEFDTRYTKNILPKDINNMVLNIQKGGVSITDYTVENVEDVANRYEMHKVKLTPVKGKSSTIHFKIPLIDDNGTFTSNGVKYRMRKQRADKPIRKIKPEKVALTSYYGKVFVERNPKVVHNYSKWLRKQIDKMVLDNEDTRLSKVKTMTVALNHQQLPRVVSTLALNYQSFTIKGMDFYFNYDNRKSHFGEEWVEEAEKDGQFVIGKKRQFPITVDADNTFYLVKGEDVTVLGKIEDILELDRLKAPVDIADLKVFSKSIPVGVVLAYHFGIKRLLGSVEGDTRTVKSGEQLSLNTDEAAIRFKDETLIYSRDNKLLSILLSGFNEYKNSIKRYSIYDFNDRDVFLNLLTDHGLSNRHLNELEMLNDYFIDPITEELLVEMGEPTNWFGLLKRSCELLLTDYSPSETDLDYMRIRGYERIAGGVYLEIVNSMRDYRGRGLNPNASVQMDPYAVWTRITRNDPSVTIEEDTNPIQNLKQKEAVTFMGEGGRSRVSMVGRTRLYTQSDMGVISEATVDSGDVAINASTSANPNFISLRGTTKPFDGEKDTAANVVSTTALLMPGSDRDDPKRTNFASVQHAQGISSIGYKPTPLRTGYERVISHRTDDNFAATAKQKGVVKKITKDSIVVTNEDGTERSVVLGRLYGSGSGSTYPHNLETRLKEGEKVKVGDCIAFNSNFFTPDPLNEKEVLWKAGVMSKVALVESTDTFEDSSAISEKLSNEMSSEITYTKTMFFDFEQEVKNFIELGETVTPETILCTIEDAVGGEISKLDDRTSDALQLLTANTPRAGYSGKIEKIRVTYYGNKDDMSPSLRAIADQSDKQLAKERKALGQSVVTGEVRDSIRIDSTIVEIDQAVIQVYITGADTVGLGDKGVFGSQMKTVFARVMSGINETESGEELDALFSYASIDNRIVLSPILIGTTNTLLRVIGQRIANEYLKPK